MAGALDKLNATLTKNPDVSGDFAQLFKDELSRVEVKLFEDMPLSRLPGLAVSDYCVRLSNSNNESFKVLLGEIYNANALANRGKNSLVADMDALDDDDVVTKDNSKDDHRVILPPPAWEFPDCWKNGSAAADINMCYADGDFIGRKS